MNEKMQDSLFEIQDPEIVLNAHFNTEPVTHLGIVTDDRETRPLKKGKSSELVIRRQVAEKGCTRTTGERGLLAKSESK